MRLVYSRTIWFSSVQQRLCLVTVGYWRELKLTEDAVNSVPTAMT